MLLTLIVFIVIFGLLIFVHELGHFLTAKRSGIKVEEFAFGFPPRVFAVKKGETEYAINLIPFGGYVRMLGEEEDPTASEKANKRSFAHQSVWTRSKVVVAGVLMNFIFAWLLLTLGYLIGMTPFFSDPAKIPFAKANSAVVISAVAGNSVASTMGLKPNDKVVSINGEAIKSSQQLSDFTKANTGKDISLVTERKKVKQTLTGKLGTGEGPLGVRLTDDSKVRLPFWWAPVYAVWDTLKAIGLTFSGTIDFFKQLVVRHSIPAEAAGPVGIYDYTRSFIQLGFTAVLAWAAMLSVNLGVINILPFPALDGGRLLFIILEKFNKGHKVVNQRIENIAHMIGFALLILLIITITFHDVARLMR